MGAYNLANLMVSGEQKIDEALEKRICQAFMKHLDDVSLDVQSNAVNCIQKTADIVTD